MKNLKNYSHYKICPRALCAITLRIFEKFIMHKFPHERGAPVSAAPDFVKTVESA